jgi:WD40 repeat protein
VDWYTDEGVVGNQRLYHTKLVDGTWTAPQIAPFTENIHVPVQRPVFSPDGSKLYIEYGSNPNHESDSDIYVVERIGEGWSEPVPVSPLINSPAIERLHCVTADGSLYFSRDPFTANEEIFVSRFVDGAFTEPVKLGESYNSDDYEVAILIAPNEEYMLIEQMNTQHTSSRLTISYKSADGSWSDRIKTPYECGGFLALSPDGEYLFFLGEGIYWVSTSFVDDLKPPTVDRLPEAAQAIISLDTVDQIVQQQSLSGHTDLVYDLAFTPDARLLASGSMDGTIRLRDVISGQTIHTLRHSGGVCRLAMSPDGSLLTSGGLKRNVKLWDLETGQVVHTFGGYDGAVCGLDFSPDGALLATGSVDKSVKLWDVASGQLRHTLTGHTSAVFSVAFEPDGILLASGSARPELQIKLWDVESGQEVHTLTGQETDVHDLVFSSDGSLLAAVGPMAEVRLWDAASGQVAQDLQGHNGNVFGTAFSVDGSLLASSADDGTVRLWNVATGRVLRALRHDGEGSTVAFSPDGSLLASDGSGNTVILWGIPASQ